MDRIFAPAEFTNLQNLDIKNISVLKCKNCNEVLGTPYIYPEERRKAFRLYQDTVVKKIKKIN
jgi:hypothetical protein